MLFAFLVGVDVYKRQLWTFSAAYRLLKRPEYLETATRAKRTLIDRFYDNEFGGVCWSLDYKGDVYKRQSLSI